MSTNHLPDTTVTKRHVRSTMKIFEIPMSAFTGMHGNHETYNASTMIAFIEWRVNNHNVYHTIQ